MFSVVACFCPHPELECRAYYHYPTWYERDRWHADTSSHVADANKGDIAKIHEPIYFHNVPGKIFSSEDHDLESYAVVADMAAGRYYSGFSL